jgi:tRNA(Arg) A34 adenosine deaminase TadA
MLDDTDTRWLRHSFALARQARDRGDHPFGAVLVGAAGNLLAEGANQVVNGRDFSAHAEIAVLRTAWRQGGEAALAGACLYSSCEPCAMCAGGIHWSGLTRVVYGMAADSLYPLMGPAGQLASLAVGCRQVLGQSGRPIEVSGPHLTEEAEQVHLGYWTQ